AGCRVDERRPDLVRHRDRACGRDRSPDAAFRSVGLCHQVHHQRSDDQPRRHLLRRDALCADDVLRPRPRSALPGAGDSVDLKLKGKPMARRIVDLSVPLEMEIASDPQPMLPKIIYMDHKATAEQMTQFFPGLKVDQLPGGEGWAVEQLSISTH